MDRVKGEWVENRDGERKCGRDMVPGSWITRRGGFSLIEMMIAIVIIMVSLLALLAMILVSMNTNMTNDLRNRAISVANQTAEALLALPLDDAALAVDSVHERTPGDAAQNEKGFPDPTQAIRGLQHRYSIEWIATAPTANVREVAITVRYEYKNTAHSYSTLIYKHAAP